MRLLLIFLILLSISLDAIADAIHDKTKKRAHGLEILFVASLLGISAYVFYYPIHWIHVVLPYVFFRASIFNVLYNKTRGLEASYVGTTDAFFDKIMRKIPTPILVTLFGVYLFLGVVFVFFPHNL